MGSFSRDSDFPDKVNFSIGTIGCRYHGKYWPVLVPVKRSVLFGTSTTRNCKKIIDRTAPLTDIPGIYIYTTKGCQNILNYKKLYLGRTIVFGHKRTKEIDYLFFLLLTLFTEYNVEVPIYISKHCIAVSDVFG